MKMQKILVSGAGGFVGARVMQQWREKAELLAFPRGFLAAATQEDLCRFAAQVQPDVVLHLAALSDTGYCQQHPEDSRRANVEVPLWMARAAAETGAKLVAFSSNQVYSGAAQEGPLPETLSLSPTNIYGQHKLEAEQRVLEVLPDAVFLRVPWMYDLPGYQLPIRGNLPLNLLRAALRGTPVQFSAHDWRGISFVREVIENLYRRFPCPAVCTTLAATTTAAWSRPHGSSRNCWAFPLPSRSPTGTATCGWMAAKQPRRASPSAPRRRGLRGACGSITSQAGCDNSLFLEDRLFFVQPVRHLR